MNKMRTLAYTNWWYDPSSPRDWYFSRYIDRYICPIKVVEPTSSPDILFCSVFGPIEAVNTCDAKLKVFFTGENLRRFPEYDNTELLQENFDLILGFCRTDLAQKTLRFPTTG